MTNSKKGGLPKKADSFLSGGGEMGDIIREMDWRKTPLGDPKNWPLSLRTMVSVMLDNPFGMYIAWGKEYTQIYNDGFRPILGSAKHPKALGISPAVTFKEIWNIIGPMFEKVMKGHSFREADFKVPLNRNGFTEECYFDFSCSPIRNEDGKTGGILVTIIETTGKNKAEDELKDLKERKLALEALKESEERFRTLADNISQLVWMTDETGWIFWYNKRWFEYTGTTIEEMEGWGWKKVHHPDYLEAVEKKFRKMIEKGEVWEDTFPLRASDGSYRWFLSRAIPIKNENGQVIRWFGTNTDITEIIRVEQELKESETRFRMFADSMPQIVWAANANGKLTYINKAFYSYSGLSASDNINQEWIEIIHPEDREESIQEWNECIKSGREFNLEHRFRIRDGHYRWQLSRAVPLKDANGNIESWVGTSTDIQEIKELDLQKDHFISIASHELKTPITSIKGYIQILLSTYNESKDEFLKKSLAAVDKQIIKLTNLISDLLDLSKLKLGNLHLVKESFNMNELIEEVVEEIRLINKDYQIEVTFKTNANIFADRERVAQVIINFLTNAIKYSPRNKLIQVKSFLKENHMTVLVKDQGIGINKKSQEKIFERFYRVEGKNEETYPGFGIGLFISSEIIRRHNGEIGVKSLPGKGSQFHFSLPID